jgi:hypothetical protein
VYGLGSRALILLLISFSAPKSLPHLHIFVHKTIDFAPGTVTGQFVLASTNSYLGPVSEVRLTFYPSPFDPPYSDGPSVRKAGHSVAMVVCLNKVDDPRYQLTTEHNTPPAMGEWSQFNTKSAKWGLLDL